MTRTTAPKGLLLLLGACLMASCAKEEKQPPPPVPVTTVKSMTQDVPVYRVYPGKTQSVRLP